MVESVFCFCVTRWPFAYCIQYDHSVGIERPWNEVGSTTVLETFIFLAGGKLYCSFTVLPLSCTFLSSLCSYMLQITRFMQEHYAEVNAVGYSWCVVIRVISFSLQPVLYLVSWLWLTKLFQVAQVCRFLVGRCHLACYHLAPCYWLQFLYPKQALL